MLIIASLLASYLAGSIPSALWIGHAVRGIDIRQHGSGNPGATNAARVLGLRWGLLAAAIDIAKGFAPVFWLGPIAAHPLGWDPVIAGISVGVAAIVGHLFPVFAGFRGGKGVLTALGMFVALLPIEAAIALGVWAIVFGISRIVSLGSLSAAVAFCAAVAVRRFVLGQPIHDALLSISVVLLALVFYTHRANIMRIRAGTEHRFRRSG